jgi:hypothetical protein
MITVEPIGGSGSGNSGATTVGEVHAMDGEAGA